MDVNLSASKSKSYNNEKQPEVPTLLVEEEAKAGPASHVFMGTDPTPSPQETISSRIINANGAPPAIATLKHSAEALGTLQKLQNRARIRSYIPRG